MSFMPPEIRRLWPYLDLSPKRLAWAVLLGIGALGSALGLAAVSAWLIARASQMPPVLTLSVAAVGVRMFGITRGLLRYLERLASHNTALRGSVSLRENLYRELSSAGTAHVLRLRRGDLLSRVGADVDEVGNLVVRGILPTFVTVGVSALAVVIVGVFLPLAGLALAAALVVAGAVAPALTVRAVRMNEELGAQARADVSASVLTALDGAGQFQVAGSMTDELARLADADARVVQATDRSARPAALGAAVNVFAMGFAVVAAILFGAPAVTSGALAPVELAVIVLVPLAAFEAAGMMPTAAIQLYRSRAAARRLVDLLDAADDGPAAGHVIHEGHELRAQGLAVGWPGATPLLTDLSLEVSPGVLHAIVGESGSGKTTLLLTLAEQLPPQGGTLTVPLSAAAAPAPTVAITREDAHVFETTVLENLRVARADVSAEEAADMLASMGLATWLAALPDGLDTMLGPDALTLSGGERRRLLLARALLTNAPYLLLDEPTEHLDVNGRREIMETLARECRERQRGIIIATHNAADLDAADAIHDLAILTGAQRSE